MTPREAGVAAIRRLLVEVRLDRGSMEKRSAEVRRFSETPAGSRPERPAAIAFAVDRAYSAFEALIERSLLGLEGSAPSGEDWHAELLRIAALDIPGVRPCLLGQESWATAHRLRGFRHFLRHAYPTEIDESKVDDNARAWLDAQGALRADLDRLDAFLMALIEKLAAAGHPPRDGEAR